MENSERSKSIYIKVLVDVDRDSPKNAERPPSGNGQTGVKNTKLFIEKEGGRYVDIRVPRARSFTPRLNI